MKVAALSTSVAVRLPLATSVPSSVTEPTDEPVMTASSLMPAMVTVIVCEAVPSRLVTVIESVSGTLVVFSAWMATCALSAV